MKALWVCLVSAILLFSARPAAASTFDDECRAAMAPYYAALLTSSRNDGEGTLRHLLALRGRWSRVQAVPASGRPAWTVEGSGSLLDVISSRIDAARARTLARDVAGAHAMLESIRALLRDARAAAGVRTFDDAVTDFHEAMERLTGRAGLHNEIVLNADDYAAIEAHVAHASASWAEIRRKATTVTTAGDWRQIDGATDSILARLRTATLARDMGATQVASEELRARYFDLLAALARG